MSWQDDVVTWIGRELWNASGWRKWPARALVVAFATFGVVALVAAGVETIRKAIPPGQPSHSGIPKPATIDASGPVASLPATTNARPSCGPDRMDCGNGCVDTNTSAQDCGGCGLACDAGFGCMAGHCRQLWCAPITGRLACFTTKANCLHDAAKDGGRADCQAMNPDQDLFFRGAQRYDTLAHCKDAISLDQCFVTKARWVVLE